MRLCGSSYMSRTNKVMVICRDIDIGLEPMHKVFISYSGAQRAFAESLCVDLERCIRFPSLDNLQARFPVGESFRNLFGMRSSNVILEW